VFWYIGRKDSGRVLAMAAFSRFRLPADWVLLENGRASVYSVKSPFFGYEAIRVPLYEAWDGQAEGLNAFGEYLSFVERAGYLPSRVNLVDGSVAMDEAPAGFYAVVSACAGALGRKDLSRALAEKAASKIDREPKDYFSNSLYLLARGRLNQP
jgi:endoglucanase